MKNVDKESAARLAASRRAAARKRRVTVLAKELCNRFGEHPWDAIPEGDAEPQSWWRAHAEELVPRG